MPTVRTATYLESAASRTPRYRHAVPAVEQLLEAVLGWGSMGSVQQSLFVW
jgi:hypothetical protein